MSEDQPTYTDPHTGAEIEPTWLARGRSVLAWMLGYVLIVGLVVGLIWGVSAVLSRVLSAVPVDRLMDRLGDGLCVVMFLGIFLRWIHASITRRQHRRHRNILRSQDPTHVPDTALSRVQPPGRLTPTDAALSVADDPEGTEHLGVGSRE